MAKRRSRTRTPMLLRALAVGLAVVAGAAVFALVASMVGRDIALAFAGR